MLIDAMGLILADNDYVRLGELTAVRALAAVPFAGRYRIIDFALSNMVNSGIKRVGVMTLSKYRSLMDHMGTGSYWDLDRMTQSLFILPPFMHSADGISTSNLTGILDYMKNGSQKYLVIADSNVVANTPYNEMLEAHISSGADITAMYNHDGNDFGSPTVTLDFDDNNVVVDMLIDSPHPPNRTNFMGVICIGRELMIELLEEAIARDKNQLTQVNILKHYNELKVMGYENEDMCLRINSVATYFQASMKLLDTAVRHTLYNPEKPIYTKVKNEVPAEFKKGSRANNLLSSDGCIIYGEVADSVLFRGVRIGAGSVVRNSIVMQDVTIGDNVTLDHVIIDKDCVINDGVELKGHLGFPVMIAKGSEV